MKDGLLIMREFVAQVDDSDTGSSALSDRLQNSVDVGRQLAWLYHRQLVSHRQTEKETPRTLA